MTSVPCDTDSTNDQALVVPRAEHCISRKQIDENTLKVLYRLRRHGYQAYLVGGGVRDLLLGRQPKDFDVATDATPEQVKGLFRNCFLVGRRFRLAHIRFAGNYLVEVATFRRQPRPEELPADTDEHFFFTENVFGSPREDAFRRDFSINGLFYNIEDFSVIDHVGGLQDLADRRLRVIGDPLVRFTEDPVRMLRALEFTARLGFNLDESVRQAIYLRAPLIAEAATARIREELMELFRHKVAAPVLRDAQSLGLLPHLLGGFEGEVETFELLEQIDRRTDSGRPIEEHLALAALFLERYRHACQAQEIQTIGDAIRIANHLLVPHCGYFRISNAIRHQARELLVGFFRLARGRGRRGEGRFLRHPFASASVELFSLWSEASGREQELAADWRQAIEGIADPSAKKKQGEATRRRPRRRRKSRRPPVDKKA
ncbi:poly(A) polymerase [Syntrophotalea acetylenivorans]|uniref:Poly(A) polymerase I n=1 Tax=Syntrophotalea acetylenivorans TaxID=1842532 RepID=A0A1L3GRD6_9BACT|nr:polynucleotide adenylyltransferase PcnB [Syntrophotalea acetylenivorans]APG28475.1 poly(A) polymerase [Syntrophotalea acetylenivorans]